MTKTNRRTEATHHRATRPTARTAFLDLPVREVMRTDMVTVSTSAPLSEVERTISESRIGGVPVTDATGQVVGVLSLHDIVDRYSTDPDARPGRHAFYHIDAEDLEEDDLEGFEVPPDAEETAGDVMSAQVLSVPATATLREVAREMLHREVHRLLVRDHGRMAGIVTTMDLLRAMAQGT